MQICDFDSSQLLQFSHGAYTDHLINSENTQIYVSTRKKKSNEFIVDYNEGYCSFTIQLDFLLELQEFKGDSIS